MPTIPDEQTAQHQYSTFVYIVGEPGGGPARTVSRADRFSLDVTLVANCELPEVGHRAAAARVETLHRPLVVHVAVVPSHCGVRDTLLFLQP